MWISNCEKQIDRNIAKYKLIQIGICIYTMFFNELLILYRTI